MVDFPKRIRALRIAKQMSQAEVGNLVGVSRAAVHQWESGRSLPHIHHMQELARFFGVSITALLGGPEISKSVDDELRMLPTDISDALKASFLATIEAIKKNKT